MKNIFRLLSMSLVALVASATIVSCSDDDENEIPYDDFHSTAAIVTLKTQPSSGQLYMQLNDSVTIIPNNIKQSPFGNKELRALIYFNPTDSIKGHYSFSADVFLRDTIRTKRMSPLVSDADKAYGNDPVEIVNSWETCSEDGYLTLRFRTYFGGHGIHSLYLVRTGEDTVQLYHNANGDTRGEVGDGLIAFRLNELPETNGKYKEFTLKWNSFSGEKSLKLKYKSRE